MRSIRLIPAGRISRKARRERDTMPILARRKRASGISMLSAVWSCNISEKEISALINAQEMLTRTIGEWANICHLYRFESDPLNSQALFECQYSGGQQHEGI